MVHDSGGCARMEGAALLEHAHPRPQVRAGRAQLFGNSEGFGIALITAGGSPDQLRQQTLFGPAEDLDWWRDEWQGMPEFVQEDLSPFRSITVHFENRDDVRAFSKLIAQRIGPNVKWLWFPEVKNIRHHDRRYINEP